MDAFRAMKILVVLASLVVLTGMAEVGRRSARRWWKAATYEVSTGRFQDPEGLAVDARGYIYVADEDRGLLTLLDREDRTLSQVHYLEGYEIDGQPAAITSGDGMVLLGPGRILAIAQFNLAEIEFEEGEAKLVRVIGLGKGTGPEYFGDPEGIARHPDSGEIYVTDEDNRRIKVYDSDGKLLRSWPVPQDPESIVVLEDRAYVTFSKDDWIGCYSLEGELRFRFGEKGAGATDNPEFIGVSPDGLLYVTDQRNGRIQVYDSEGNHCFSIGSWGRDLGEFRDPEDLAFNLDGDLVVADGGNHRIQVLTKEGIPIREIR
jgi:DNA-binding beta-propeller fold protein YncE